LPFIVGVISLSFWAFQALNQVQTTNLTQDQKIDTKHKNIEALTLNISTLSNNTTQKFEAQNTSNNEIIRRLDALQTGLTSLQDKK